MSKKMCVIWIIFTILFFVLGCFHLVASRNNISLFQVSERPLSEYMSIKISGADIDEPLKDFARDFNSYLDSYNESSRRQNIMAAFGYFFASAAALFSMFLGLRH